VRKIVKKKDGIVKVIDCRARDPMGVWGKLGQKRVNQGILTPLGK
jgi:hypothetical protein